MAEARDALLDGLNPAQREAVEHVDGPLLIVAGPGSGKTRVITHRIAYLVTHVGIGPGRIAAVTFTNRAAREMRSRLQRLLGDRARHLVAGTFHGLCVIILRRDGEAIGVPPDFVIMDDEDQISLIKRSMEIVEIDPKRFPPRAILSAISSAKSQLLGPEGVEARATGYYDEVVQRIYAQYQVLLARTHGLDFDDLLAKTVSLMQQAPTVREKYQERFIHLMVDEFQDTNVAQYTIARELSGKYRNLAVVGDPDQSIYAWRNADIRNILSFQRDYPGAKVVNLSENYRSTETILAAAQAVISTNRQRLELDLFTHNDRGKPIVIAEAFTEDEEAEMVVEEVQRLAREDGYSLRDCVVTYRVNAQSRALEEACLRYGMPYKLIGGVRFYQRREVKDLIAYMRLLQDPYDDVSLTRVINVPARGLGKRTVDDLIAWAGSLGLPAYSALQLLAPEQGQEPSSSPFDARQRRGLVGFLGLVNGLREQLAEVDLTALIDVVMERTGYRAALLESGDVDAEDRLDNLRELRGMTADFDGPAAESLAPFLESAALVSDQDALTEDDQQYLTLITLHQIKGLEFPVVFMTGFEEGVLPHVRSLDDPEQLEEERRIAYVGMTRAEQRLYLLRSFRRRLAGAPQANPPSRFLLDIPYELVDTPARERVIAGGRSPARLSALDREAAAAVAAGDRAADLEPPPFKAGDKITHASFGKGIVVSCTAKPGDYEITVAFAGDAGVKRLLHSFAKLEMAGQPTA
ncbi:MAG: UvrD-helicase domain-containing protein [Chloroflexi bacterium]|nr:UvrD-helicase domain-containing protein [Chloroflexota bacterium]